jgi:hypothetical protein
MIYSKINLPTFDFTKHTFENTLSNMSDIHLTQNDQLNVGNEITSDKTIYKYKSIELIRDIFIEKIYFTFEPWIHMSQKILLYPIEIKLFINESCTPYFLLKEGLEEFMSMLDEDDSNISNINKILRTFIIDKSAGLSDELAGLLYDRDIKHTSTLNKYVPGAFITYNLNVNDTLENLYELWNFYKKVGTRKEKLMILNFIYHTYELCISPFLKNLINTFKRKDNNIIHSVQLNNLISINNPIDTSISKIDLKDNTIIENVYNEYPSFSDLIESVKTLPLSEFSMYQHDGHRIFKDCFCKYFKLKDNESLLIELSVAVENVLNEMHQKDTNITHFIDYSLIKTFDEILYFTIHDKTYKFDLTIYNLVSNVIVKSKTSLNIL